MADKPDTSQAQEASSSCGGGHQVLPAAVLPTAVILSDIVSGAGAARVRSWIVELKGRRRGRNETASEPDFSVCTSMSAVHITKDSGLMIRHMSLSVPRIYANNPSPPVFRMCCHRKQNRRRTGQPPPPLAQKGFCGFSNYHQMTLNTLISIIYLMVLCRCV